MSVPKKKRTKSSVGQRRSHQYLKKIVLVKCKKCDKPIKPHRLCPFCKTYKIEETKSKK